MKQKQNYLPYPEIYADYWPHHKYDVPIPDNDKPNEIQIRYVIDKHGNKRVDCLYGYSAKIIG